MAAILLLLNIHHALTLFHFFLLLLLLRDSPYIANLTVESPVTDTAGTGMLLWTIGEFGDDSIPGLSGVYNYNASAPSAASNTTTNIKNWQQWWTQALASNISVTNDWTTAFDLYSTANSSTAMMMSYGNDPAYNVCQVSEATDVVVIRIG